MGLGDKGVYRFSKPNKISCVNVSFKKVVWNYICWALGGKPSMKKEMEA